MLTNAVQANKWGYEVMYIILVKLVHKGRHMNQTRVAVMNRRPFITGPRWHNNNVQEHENSTINSTVFGHQVSPETN